MIAYKERYTNFIWLTHFEDRKPTKHTKVCIRSVDLYIDIFTS